MAVGETPGQGCQSDSKSSLEFRHTNTMKSLRFVWITVSDCRKQRGPPDAGNNLQKTHFIMCHVTKYSTIRGVFQQPWSGVSPTAILNEEKALGTRLGLFVCGTFELRSLDKSGKAAKGMGRAAKLNLRATLRSDYEYEIEYKYDFGISKQLRSKSPHPFILLTSRYGCDVNDNSVTGDNLKLATRN